MSYIYRDYAYLDTTTLNTIADSLEIPHTTTREVTQRKNRTHAGDAKIHAGIVGAQGTTNQENEYQETYSLTKDNRAAATKLIHSLLESGNATSLGSLTKDKNLPQFKRGVLLEVTGQASLAAASAFGTLYQHFNPLLQKAENIEELNPSPREIDKIAKRYMLTNEMPNIPLLYALDVEGYLAAREIRVYLNFEPGHFIHNENSISLEDQVSAFGYIEKIIIGGDEGYSDASAWMFPGLNPRTRNLVLAQNDLPNLQEILGELNPDVASWEHPEYIKGPAIIIRVVAMY